MYVALSRAIWNFLRDVPNVVGRAIVLVRRHSLHLEVFYHGIARNASTVGDIQGSVKVRFEAVK